MTTSDPFRDDAAVVFRALRDSGDVALSAASLAERCFPTAYGEADPLYKSLRKRGLRRVLDSLVWMRHEGVTLTAVPMPDGTTVFTLGAVAVSVTPFVRERPEFAMPVSSSEEEVVTAKVSQPRESSIGGEAMDVWHGK